MDALLPSPQEEPYFWYELYLETRGEDLFSAPIPYEEFCQLDEDLIHDLAGR